MVARHIIVRQRRRFSVRRRFGFDVALEFGEIMLARDLVGTRDGRWRRQFFRWRFLEADVVLRFGDRWRFREDWVRCLLVMDEVM
ncbi:MAG: hypothetical protein ACRENC_19335, partial [Gemmatimonadaceae bacterium]